MKIVLHILAKDLRRHWREIALYLLACAAWAWQTAEPFALEWLHQHEFTPVLMFGLWFFIVIRIVQGELLVGDREFWMTRPYRWGQLMAAKAMALVLCLNLPLLIAQIALLDHAGFPFSLHLLPGLLFLQLMFVFFLTFPAAALAAVTESIVQWGLAIAGIAIYALIVSWLPWDKLPPALESGETLGTILCMAAATPALVFVLLWQYARRRAWPARLAFAGVLLVIPLIVVLACTPIVRSIAYPKARGQAPLHISIANDEKEGSRIYVRSNPGSTANISLPVEAVPSDPDAIVSVDGLQITLAGDNGWRWQSPWLNHSIKFSKDSSSGYIQFSIPNELADQMARVHAQAKVEMAFKVYRLGPQRQIATRDERFFLPGDTVCRWGEINGYEVRYYSAHDCVAPFRSPELMVLRTDSGTNTCTIKEDETPLPAGHIATDSEYGTSLPAEFDPNPVHKINLNFSDWVPAIPNIKDPQIDRIARFCRGTPITVRTGTLQGTMSAVFDLGNMGKEMQRKDEPEDSIQFSPKDF
jgi:hypothetical protein